MRCTLACRPRKAAPKPKARRRPAAASSDASDDDSGSEYEPAAEEAAAAAADEAIVDLTQATDSDGDAGGAAGGQVSGITSCSRTQRCSCRCCPCEVVLSSCPSSFVASTS